MRKIKGRKTRNVEQIFHRIFQFILWLEYQDKLHVITRIVINGIIINDLIDLYIDDNIYSIGNTVGHIDYTEYDSFEEFISAVKERGIIDLPNHLLPEKFPDYTSFFSALVENGFVKNRI